VKQRVAIAHGLRAMGAPGDLDPTDQ